MVNYSKCRFYYFVVWIFTDIQFWRNRKSLEGLSVRSVFFSVFQSLIVLLYILDNETNFIVIISVGIGLLIDAWKITQVVNVKVSGVSTEYHWISFMKSPHAIAQTQPKVRKSIWKNRKHVKNKKHSHLDGVYGGQYMYLWNTSYYLFAAGLWE